MDRFDDYIERVLSHEAGYVDDPSDPGGETKWGISKRSYPHVDIKALSRNDAIAIYRQDFWNPLRAWQLPSAFSFQALDAAVNHGSGNALRWIQRAVGVADDGWIGPATLKAIANADERDLFLLFNAERLEFYTKLTGWARYGKGWTRRVAKNLRHAAEDNDD